MSLTPVAEWKSDAEEVHHVDRKFVRLSLSTPRDNLMHAFTWSSTPQGAMYWSLINQGAKGLTEDDRSFLVAVLLWGSRRMSG